MQLPIEVTQTEQCILTVQVGKEIGLFQSLHLLDGLMKVMLKEHLIVEEVILLL